VGSEHVPRCHSGYANRVKDDRYAYARLVTIGRMQPDDPPTVAPVGDGAGGSVELVSASAQRSTRGGTEQRSVSRTLVTGAGWNTLSQAVPLACNVGLTPFLIHGLGIARWGFIALVTSLQSMLATFDGGLVTSTQRLFAVLAGTDDRQQTTRMLIVVCLIIAAFGMIVSVAAWFLAPSLMTLFHATGAIRPEGIFLLRTVGLLVAVGFLHNTFGSVLNARNRFAMNNLVTIGTYLVWGVGLFLTVRLGWGLRGVALVFIAQQMLATLLVVPSATAYLSRKGIGLPRWAEARELFRYSAKLQVMGLSYLCNTQVDGLVVGATLSLKPLAYYNTGSGFVTQLRGASYNALTPMITHLSRTVGAHGEKAAYHEYLRLQRLWVVAVSGWSAAAAGAAYFGITAWLGSSFRLAGEIALVLLIGHAAALCNWLLAVYCTAVGRPELEMRYGIISMLINVGLTIPLAFTGAIGIVAATSISMVVASMTFIRMVRRSFLPDLPNYFTQIPFVKVILTAIVVVLLELAIRPIVPSGPFGLLLCAVPAALGLAFYGGTLFGFRIIFELGRDALSGAGRASLLPTIKSLVREF
jgi:O-antigen/teichoic acid export membrane protein